ncbi:MAG: CBS domain-containing protein [Gammaproteobacteria bacterium]|jgi:CBS domain-containing protein|nr:CBS domain-containing protein [Gammaproteobacteria bacterium]MBT4491882.1 CBS domain-containing protein [Gammaproteobacteria bacterium]MBT7369621.1 CBS domain-containing protein [Gammaproteobacteria bacterium]
MAKVADLMKKDPVSLDPEARIEEAWKIMHDQRVRHIPVCKGPKLVGLITQKDLLVNAQANSLLTMPIAEVMVFNVKTTEQEVEIASAAQTMLEERISCLPVVEDGNLTGIITESDFLQLLINLLKK